MAISKIWKIRNKTKGGAFVTFDTHGITQASGRFLSMATDTVNITFGDSLYDENHTWAYKDEVEIQRDGVIWFRGVITTNPRTGTPASESYSFTLSGAWWWLEQTTYMAKWASGQLPDPEDPPETPITVENKWMSQTRLFVDKDGNKVSLKTTIEEIFSYATAQANIPLQLGTIVDNIIPWPSEAKDVTIATLIKRVMQWSPSTIMQVDYSTSPPTCNFIKRANAPTYQVDLNQKHFVTSNNIQSREDLVPPSVCISYEFDNQHNDRTFRKIIQDIAPAGANCLQPGSVNITLPMRGFRKTTQIVSVRTTKIPDNPLRKDPDTVAIDETNGTLGSNDVTRSGVGNQSLTVGEGRKWWIRHHPELKEYKADKYVIAIEKGKPATETEAEVVPTYSFSEELEEEDPPEPISKLKSKLRFSPLQLSKSLFDPASETPLIEEYHRELVAGQLSEWMGVTARDIDVKAKIYYLDTDEAFEKLTEEQKAHWPHTELSDTTIQTEQGEQDVSGKRYSIATNTIVGTNAITNNYARTTSAIGEEDIPNNLASHYLSEYSQLHWQGNLVSETNEVEQDLHLGKALNLINGHTKWQTMRAQIQQVAVDLNNGRTTWTFGPPNHLSLGDILTLLRLENETPLAPEIARDEVEYEPDSGTAKIDKATAGYQGPKAKGKMGGGGGGAPAEGCTKLKPILTKEDDKYMLEVTEGLFAAGFTSLPKTEITGATKIWGLLKIFLVVEKSSSVVNLEDIFYYTGGIRAGAFDPGMGLGIEIILAEEDPTTFVNTPLTNDEDRRVDFAMLIGEITEETENGETAFKLKEIECGNKLFKFCPPESAFFINQ